MNTRISETEFNSGEYTNKTFLKTNKDGSKVYVAGHTCRRCGGSGNYSYNQRDGFMCLECRGAGRARYTFSVVDDAKMEKEKAKKKEAYEKKIVEMKESFYRQMERQVNFLKEHSTWTSAISKFLTSYNPANPTYECVAYTKCCLNYVKGDAFSINGKDYVKKEAIASEERFINLYNEIVKLKG